ncbi:alpha/beta hydrolase-fold protein [Sphingomonas sp. 4RDLI-65]|uniref:alpha/beta hydrolase n=1 Tax=Sphingomonas sp. 4RDLI-65 TaxID=3111641 RepID=UPI003C1AAF08
MILLLAAAAPARTSPVAAETPLVRMPGTRELALKGPQGADYRIWISEPVGPVPYTGGYRVLYVLDGNAFFGLFHDAKRLQDAFADTIIVSVGYPTDKPYDFARRAYDFTPPAPGAKPAQGGQDALLDFLEQTLKPAIAARYRIDTDQESLFGHSFGGMFALYAMYTRPALFDHYVAASPTLWWANRYLLPSERAFAARVARGEIDVRQTSLLLAVGDVEPAQEVQDVIALERRLQPLSAQGLRTSVRLQPGEDHMSLPPSIVSQVLREVFTARTR